MYETVRSIASIEKDNLEKLVDVIKTRAEFRKLLKPYKGEKVVVLSNPSFSRDVDIIRGGFRGGHFKDIAFYKPNCGVREKNIEFDAHIWFEGGGFATGLSYVYDIMFVDSVDSGSEKISNYGIDDLKIFNFGASAALESESASVIHVDPFLAYIALKDSKKPKSGEQYLGSVEPLKTSVIFYGHTSY